MTQLEHLIRAELERFCSDSCAEACERTMLALLDLHTGDAHACIKDIAGYTVQAWYGPDEDCPTIIAIARGFRLLGEET